MSSSPSAAHGSSVGGVKTTEAQEILERAMTVARAQLDRVLEERPAAGSPVDLPDDIVAAMGVARATIDRDGVIRVIAHGYAKSLTVDVSFSR